MRPDLSFFAAIPAVALFTLLPLGVAAQENDSDLGQIVVSASASVEAVPDVVEVTVGVVYQEREARAALSEMNAAAAGVFARVREFGVADRDMQSSGLSLQPVYASSSVSGMAEVSGYRASTSLTIRVRDLDAVGQILDAVVTDGANELSGLRFTVSDPEPLLEEARRAAVQAAMAKAELLAEEAGVTLGPLLSLTESSAGMPRPMEASFMRGADAVPVASGEVSLSATVSMTYRIES